MPAPIAAYIVAFSALASCGVSALTLIYVVNHFDPPEERQSVKSTGESHERY